MLLKRALLIAATLTILLAIGVTYWVSAKFHTSQHVTTAEVRIPTKEQIETDLQLRLELDDRGKTIQAGGSPWVRAKLVNTSKTRTHRVVKPGHGSEIANREPHFHWTATQDRGDGNWLPVPEADIGYCGTCLLYASLWERDWITLSPGEQLELHQGPLLEFQRVGRVRLQAHYDFRGDRGNKEFSPEELGAFALVPAFSLTSTPVEFDVIRPLDVRVVVKGTLKVKQETRLSDVLSITVVNQSNEPVACAMPTLHSPGGRVFLKLDAELGWSPRITEQRAVYADENVAVKPQQEVPLLGAGEFANGLDGVWEYPRKETVRVRAGYMPKSREYTPTVWSDWVEVQVVE